MIMLWEKRVLWLSKEFVFAFFSLSNTTNHETTLPCWGKVLSQIFFRPFLRHVRYYFPAYKRIFGGCSCQLIFKRRGLRTVTTIEIEGYNGGCSFRLKLEEKCQKAPWPEVRWVWFEPPPDHIRSFSKCNLVIKMVTTKYFQWPEAKKKLFGGVRDLLEIHLSLNCGEFFDASIPYIVL